MFKNDRIEFYKLKGKPHNALNNYDSMLGHIHGYPGWLGAVVGMSLASHLAKLSSSYPHLDSPAVLKSPTAFEGLPGISSGAF